MATKVIIREELIEMLLERDVESSGGDYDDLLSLYRDLKCLGCRGYDNWSDEELLQEAVDRELIDRDTLELL